VAVPVIDVRKRVRAALAIAAPRVRPDIAEAPAIAQTLRPGAAKIGEILLV
jgi:DNA-binding IclR family transcriptional regulator